MSMVGMSSSESGWPVGAVWTGTILAVLTGLSGLSGLSVLDLAFDDLRLAGFWFWLRWLCWFTGTRLLVRSSIW